MARPQKQGLEYFPLDVVMDDSVALIEAAHGLIGFGILIKLYQKIYSEGYYYAWTEKEQLLFSNRVSVDRNTVVTIVTDCIKWGIFSAEMFDKYRILTSKGIQKRYLTSIYKRKKVETIGNYLLIDVSDSNNVEVTNVSDSDNTNTTIVTDSSSTQSKVKESKVKNNNIYSPNSIEFRLSSYLFDYIKKNNNKVKEPNMQSWSNQFYYILHIDKRDVEDVKSVIQWCQIDSFWYKNILSPDKLRKQYDKLYLQMKDKEGKHGSTGQNNETNTDEPYDFSKYGG